MSDFESRYKALNAEQKEAVDTLKGPVMVIAGPGTGKTEILTMRIANILRETKIAPEKILALTFTESGAVSMRRRLSELIGQEAYRVEISTFHSFANRIIRDYPDHFPEIIGASSITEIEQVSIIEKLLDTLDLPKLRPYGDPYYYLKDIMRSIGELKQQGVTPTQFATIAEEAKQIFYANPDLFNTKGKYEGKMKGKYDSGAKRVEKNLELVRVYEGYQAALRMVKQYDYSDMIMYVAVALEKSEDLRRVLQDAYEYFLVDEHQDTNDAQNKIIELIADKTASPNLFVVGDEKQAIYRFQGASLENFHYLKSRYPDVKLISLRNNYRSTQAILDAAQGISPREAELIAKAGHREQPANLVTLSTTDVEYYFIGKKIGALIEKGVTPEDIAILYRDNKDAIPLARMLEKLKVPFNIESDQDVLGDEEIKKLIRILRAVQHFGDDIWLVEALHVDFLGIAPLDLYKISVFAKRARMSIYNFLRTAMAGDTAGFDSEEAKIAAVTLFENLSSWKRAAENIGALEAFEMIVRDSGFLKNILNHPSATEKLAKLHALFDLLKTFVERQKSYTLHDFFAYLDLMQAHGVAIKSKDTARLPGRVRLMTSHRSKGMEFDYVFIINAVDRKWGSRFHRETLKLPNGIYRTTSVIPSSSVIPALVPRSPEGEVGKAGTHLLSDSESEDEVPDNADDDERNVFYVALTRAKKELFVTMSKTDRDGRELLSTKFITELKSDILAPFDASAYEEEYATHRAEIEFAPAPAKPPELKDKEFLNTLFDEQGLSVTAINNYLECPWHYFYVNLVRVPEAPNKHLAFGNAIHAAMKSYFDAFSEGENRGKEYMVARFEDALAREPMKENEYEEALAKGQKALAAFYDEYHAEWSPNALNEERIDGVTTSDKFGSVKLKGSLDRIEFISPSVIPAQAGTHLSSSGPVRVLDYKTGKPITRNEIEGNTKNANGNYRRQLVFYKLLLDKVGQHDMQEGVIQFVEPDDRGKFHREAFEITPGEVNVMEQQVAQIAREIKDLAFWNAGCHDPECRYCELRKGM